MVKSEHLLDDVVDFDTGVELFSVVFLDQNETDLSEMTLCMTGERVLPPPVFMVVLGNSRILPDASAVCHGGGGRIIVLNLLISGFGLLIFTS